MPDLQFGIRLTADGSVYVNNVRAANDVTEQLGAAARKAGTDVESMTGSLTRATAIGSQIGQVIGDLVKGIGRWGAESVTAAADLKDLSDATGSSVESLSRLTNSFKVSGVGPEVLSTALQRLSVNLVRQDEDGRRASRALDALGISTKDPAEAIQQLANRLATYADGAQKAALVQEILGRGAQVLLPALKDLADASDIHATVTGHQAEEAEKLEKGLRLLTVQTSALRDAILSDLVPAMNTLLESTQKFGTAGFFAFLSITPKDKEDAVGAIVDARAKVKGLREEIEALSSDSLAARINRIFSSEDLKILNAQLAVATARLAALEKLGQEKPDVWDLQGKPQAPTVAPVQKAPVDQLGKELDRLEERWRTLFSAQQANVNPQTVKALEELDKLLDNGRISWAEYQKGIDSALNSDHAFSDEQKALNELLAAAAKTTDELNDAEAKRVDTLRKTVEAMQDANDKLRDEVSVIGLTGSARALRLSQLERERALTGPLSDLERERINNLYDERDALIAAGGAAQDYVDEQKRAADEAAEAVRSIDDVGRRAFEAIGQKGESAFKTIGDAIKKYVLDQLYAMMARPILLQFAGAFTGIGGAGAASAAGVGNSALGAFGGGGGGLGSIAGSLGSLFGGGTTGLLNSSIGGGASLASLFGGATTFGTSSFVTSGALAGAGTGFGVGAGAAAGLGGAIAAIGAVVPYIAIALAIAQALGAFDHGGPKGGGFASVGSQANLLNTDRDNNRYYTPNDQDKQIGDIVNTVNRSFQDTLRGLGGSGSATFGLGYDTDPNGKAPNRISAGAVVDGKTVYDVRNLDVGRDNENLKTQLALESQRALLAALQASKLPDDIAKIVDGVTAATATQDQIDNVLAFAGAVKQLDDAVGGSDQLPKQVKDVLDSIVPATATKDMIDRALKFSVALLGLIKAVDVDPIKEAETQLKNRNVVTALRSQGQALSDLAANADGTADNVTALTQATLAYKQSLVAVLVQIRQVSEAVDQMFAGTREQIETSGLTGQDLYDYYKKRADTTVASLAGLTDPQDIQNAAQEINRFISAAFGALDAQGQADQKNPILAYIDQANAYVQQRLADIGHGVTDSSKGPLDDVAASIDVSAGKFLDSAGAFTDAATTQTDAAATMLDAANRISDAADRMQNIVVTLQPTPDVNG